MAKRINASKYKKQLFAVQRQVNTYKNMGIPAVCPYCGGKMILKKIGDYAPTSIHADDLLYVCEKYDDTCSCSLKVKRANNGALLPKSTPADNNLKSMRCEAHFYMDAILRYNIFKNRDEVYNHLSGIENMKKNHFHISMMREGRCREVIVDMLRLLAAHPGKVRGRVHPYHSEFKGVISISDKDATAKELLEKIEKKVR